MSATLVLELLEPTEYGGGPRTRQMVRTRDPDDGDGGEVPSDPISNQGTEERTSRRQTR